MLLVYILYNTSKNNYKLRLISCLTLIQEMFAKIGKNTPQLELIISRDFNCSNLL